MVQRSTPLSSVLRAYSSGGARAMIDTINDATHMQESTNAQGMRGESWPTMESPQNYGFTSVVADATKAGGMIKECAEGFVSFMGGNRNFPVMSVMDDRRHRLLNLAQDAAKGAVAMFGLKEWGQQFLNTAEGLFMTGNTEKKIRIALVKNKNGQQQSSQSQSNVVALDSGGSSDSGSGGGSSSQQKGQKTLHKEDSTIWHQMDQNESTSRNGNGYASQRDSDSTIYMAGDRTKSAQATSDHTHIKNGASIFVAGGCFTEMPFILQKDGYCKT